VGALFILLSWKKLNS